LRVQDCKSSNSNTHKQPDRNSGSSSRPTSATPAPNVAVTAEAMELGNPWSWSQRVRKTDACQGKQPTMPWRWGWWCSCWGVGLVVADELTLKRDGPWFRCSTPSSLNWTKTKNPPAKSRNHPPKPLHQTKPEQSQPPQPPHPPTCSTIA